MVPTLRIVIGVLSAFLIAAGVWSQFRPGNTALDGIMCIACFGVSGAALLWRREQKRAAASSSRQTP